MDKISENIVNICKAVQPSVVGLVVAAFLICGVAILIPSEKVQSVGKKGLPCVVIGSIIALGAVYIGEWLFNLISF